MSRDSQTAKAKEALEATREFLKKNYSLPIMEAHHDGHPMEACVRSLWDKVHDGLEELHAWN